MSKTCSAQEIEEKKRAALEKLKTKKANLIKHNNQKSGSNITIEKTSINGINGGKQTNVLPSNKSHTENGASCFLNSLKGLDLLLQRKEEHKARDAAHPYKRPAITKRIENHAATVIPEKQVAPVFNNTVTCEVYLVSENRFEVRPSGYNTQVINIFKTIPSRKYDNNTKMWSFNLIDYSLLHNQINSLKPYVIIGNIPKAVLNLCSSPPKLAEPICLESIEPALSSKLMSFQKDGVCFAIGLQGRAMICDEMGLGKTYQALAVADFYRDSWPLLICTTASARDSWSTHIRQLLPNVPLPYIQILNSNQQYIDDAKILITSYTLMERNVTQLLEYKFGFLIFDESHHLKNSKAKCTANASRLARQAKHILMLSGTPALSRPVELFTQLQMINRKFMTFMDFTMRYCDGKQTRFGWDANGQSNLIELNVILKLKFMIRRTKAEVLNDLSEKHRETVVLDPALISTTDEINDIAKNFQNSKGRERENLLLQYYSQTAVVKVKAVCAYLKQLLKEPQKFIVFAHHRVMLDGICDCLNKHGIAYIRIDGSTRSQDRAELIDLFQRKANCKIAVLSLGACNSGITLTAAELIIFAELSWNPSTLAQAESRAHRIGQLKPITCRYLMASHTADDFIWKMLKTKQDVLNQAGIFCEDLQDATATAAPTMSNKIVNYFSPNKMKSIQEEIPIVAEVNTSKNMDLSKEFENLDELFPDDDDDVFKDIIC